jgi:hypothetical protein
MQAFTIGATTFPMHGGFPTSSRFDRQRRTVTSGWVVIG